MFEEFTAKTALAACVAEILAHIRGTAASMPTKYQYPATNTSLQNEGLALINLSEEMIAYFAGTSGAGTGGNPVPTTITVTPNLPSLTGLGQTLQFSAVVQDQNGNVLTPGVGGVPALVWSSSNTTSATVNSATGLATETGNGSTVILATCGNRGGGTTLTTSGAVTLVPTTVTVSPSTASLSAVGQQQQFTAVVLDQNSNPMTPGVGGVPALIWSSLNTGAATINSSSGLATEAGAGSATIKCVCGSAGGTATLTCTVPAGLYPNKPAGLVLITTRSYTSNPDGWPTANRSGSVSNVSDATAPYSPPGCEDYIYPVGMASGDSVVEQKFTFSGGVRKLYIAIVFKISSNFVGDNSFVNKLGFVEPGNIGSIIVNANAAGTSTPFYPEIRTQANAGTDRNMGPNVPGNTGYTFPRNAWVIWEMFFVLNSTPTTADGTCDCWVQTIGQDASAVHTHALTGQMWDNAGNLFTAYDEEKIWGGNTGATLSAQQSIRMDHCALYGA